MMGFAEKQILLIFADRIGQEIYMNDNMKTIDKNKEVKRRVFSTISDEELAAKIAEEKRQNPNEFSSSYKLIIDDIFGEEE